MDYLIKTEDTEVLIEKTEDKKEERIKMLKAYAEKIAKEEE